MIPTLSPASKLLFTVLCFTSPVPPSPLAKVTVVVVSAPFFISVTFEDPAVNAPSLRTDIATHFILLVTGILVPKAKFACQAFPGVAYLVTVVEPSPIAVVSPMVITNVIPLIEPEILGVTKSAAAATCTVSVAPPVIDSGIVSAGVPAVSLTWN